MTQKQIGSVTVGVCETAMVTEVLANGSAIITSETGRVLNLQPISLTAPDWQVGQVGKITFYSTGTRGWYDWEFIANLGAALPRK
jgi:hypothetical protein